MSEKKRVVPDYYDHFHCKGGACRNSCCTGWGISVSMTEYFHLIGLDCSPRLHAKLECAFHPADSPSPERYALISPDWRGDCPMHGEDGLCMLHRECGENNLPAICRAYPRSIREETDYIKSVCSTSCEAVVETLLAEEAPLSFLIDQTNATPTYNAPSDARLKQVGQICLRLIQQREWPLPQRLKRLGDFMAAFEQNGSLEPPQSPSSDEETSGSNDDALRAVVRMLHRLSENSPSLVRFGETMLNRYDPSDASLEALYGQDRLKFEARFPDWPRYFENLLSNHMFYEDFPFTDERLSPTGEYTALVSVYAAMRVMSIGSLNEKSSLSDLADTLAGLFRCIEHAAFYLNADYLLECERQNHPTLLNDVLKL